MTNFQLLRRAEQLAKAEGGSWATKIERAQRELDRETAARRKPSTPRYGEELLHKAAVAQTRRQLPGVGNPDPDRRIEVGEVNTTEVGRVRVAVSRDSIDVHGANVLLDDVDRNLRDALIEASAEFNAAENAEEQAGQRTVITALVDAVLRRHTSLKAKVKERLADQRA